MNDRPEFLAFVLASLALIGVILCAALQVPAPQLLELVCTTALGAALGITAPTRRGDPGLTYQESGRSLPTAPPTPAPAPVVVVPTVVPPEAPSV